jgi:hypothetical protein
MSLLRQSNNLRMGRKCTNVLAKDVCIIWNRSLRRKEGTWQTKAQMNTKVKWYVVGWTDIGLGLTEEFYCDGNESVSDKFIQFIIANCNNFIRPTDGISLPAAPKQQSCIVSACRSCLLASPGVLVCATELCRDIKTEQSLLRPPLRSSVHSFWLQIKMSGYDSRRYQIFS